MVPSASLDAEPFTLTVRLSAAEVNRATGAAFGGVWPEASAKCAATWVAVSARG